MTDDGPGGTPGKLLATRRWFAPALIAAMALPFVGLATSRRAASSGNVSVHDGAVSPAAGILYFVDSAGNGSLVGSTSSFYGLRFLVDQAESIQWQRRDGQSLH